MTSAGPWQRGKETNAHSFFVHVFQAALIPFMAVSLVDMTASRDTAIIIHYVSVFLLPPYPVFGALYYIDSVSIVNKYHQFI